MKLTKPIYLTKGKEFRPDKGGYICIISSGSPQRGDKEKDCVILDVGVFPTHAAADEWYKQMLITKPWETRN